MHHHTRSMETIK